MAIERGTSGDDVLNGSGDDDIIRGRGGDDVIRGRGGDDRLDGGSGDDRIFGGSGDDDIRGGAGDDVIRAGSGDDEVRAGSGDDEVYGGSGDDRIFAGVGDDIVVGGSGDDVLAGGAGEDVFRGAGDFGEDTILDFEKGEDRLDLTAFTSYVLTQDGDDTIVTVDGGQITLRGVSPDGLADSIDIACLGRGTRVATPTGEVAVETLAVGDEVATLDGAARRIKWIGRRSYRTPFLRADSKITPVVIAAGALGDNVPTRDLTVSQEHAMYLDGGLVPARLLVNGSTIRLARNCESVEYFHIELETPDVIFAEGAPTETYVNHGNRRMFANWAEYVDRHGGEDEAPRREDGQYVRRFDTIFEGARLDAIRHRLPAMPQQAA